MSTHDYIQLRFLKSRLKVASMRKGYSIRNSNGRNDSTKIQTEAHCINTKLYLQDDTIYWTNISKMRQKSIKELLDIQQCEVDGWLENFICKLKARLRFIRRSHLYNALEMRDI